MVIAYACLRTDKTRDYFERLRLRALRHGRQISRSNTRTAIELRTSKMVLEMDGDCLTITLAASSTSEAAVLEDLISEFLDGISEEDLEYQWVRVPNNDAIKRLCGSDGRTELKDEASAKEIEE